MSMKKLKGKFRLSSSSSVSSQISIDEWNKYDDRILDCIYRSDTPKLKETLRKKGVSPVKVSRDGQTAIHIAVKKGMMESVDLMLLEQPDLSTIDIQGRTVYHIAAGNGDTIMLKKLLDYSRCNLEMKDGKEMSALHYAAGSGEAACVKLLLDNNSPVNLRDSENRTPLFMAIAEHYDKIAMTLILHGVDLNTRDNLERTPLMIACSQGMSQVVALLLSKGANSRAKDSSEKTLEMIASEEGHTEVVDILRNGADSGIVYIDIDVEDVAASEGIAEIVLETIVENGVHSDETSTNKECEEITKEVKFSSTDEPNSVVEESIVENEIGATVDVDKRQHRHSSTSSNKRKSVGKYDEQSFTTSIIESLMGFDVSSDTISEVSATEDQWHMREKLEDEKQLIENEITKRDLRIQELVSEMTSVKNKLKLETEMRFAAEKEVQELKLQIDVLMENAENTTYEDITKEVTFGSDENHLPGDTFDEENTTDQIEGETGGNENEENEDDIEKEDNNIDDKVSEEEEQLSDDSENYQQRLQVDNDSDSEDETETGYRKKSLGTAKQHIDMLEEHILSLEEDIVNKDNEISELKTKLLSARELVDLNNNTTVPLELYNQLKAEKKSERNAFKEEVRSSEDQIEKLEDMVRRVEKENVCLKNRVQSESEDSKEMEKEIDSLEEQVDKLKTQLSERYEEYKESIENYRSTLLALYQNNLDSKLNDVLARIVKLRSL